MKTYDPDINLFSYWMGKVEKSCNKNAGLLIPEYWLFNVPEDIIKCFFLDDADNDYLKVRNWIKDNVLPKIPKEEFFLFVKNGTFSGKFSGDCITKRLLDKLTESVININYDSFALGASGQQELVVRRNVWGMDSSKFPKIYNGLVLTPEFRVFYDFDNKKVVKVCNYWDWDYVSPHLYDYNDCLVFSNERKNLEEFYNLNKNKVADMVADFMKDVNMEGCWSVDIMYSLSNYYFIDMAVAERSAYYGD